MVAALARAPEELDAVPSGLDARVVVEVLEHEHEMALEDVVGPSECALALMSPFVYAKDANGTGVSGVRSPQVDAPMPVLGGVSNSAAPGHTDVVSTFCRLFGSTEPFTPEQLAALYADHEQFVSALTRVTKKLVKQGFILKADERELTRSAAKSQVAK